MATPIHNADQADYRLAQQCGADNISAADVAVSYRLDGGARPIERIGGGWSEFGLEAGSALESAEDVEGMRRVMAGRDPRTHRQLVKPKVAVAPAAKLDAAPFVAALDAAAADKGVTVAELVAADPWSVKRVERLERGVRRDAHHRAPFDDLERVATAAGIDLADVYEHDDLKKAEDHRNERVRTGVMGYDVTFDRPKGISTLQALAPEHVAARMERIHLEAVRESVAALERWTAYGMSGHHGDGQTAQRIATSGLVGTMTVHRTARPVDDQTPGDPHLHTHVMLANMARGEDGKWRTIAAGGRDLMRHVPAVGELYRAIERAKLTEELGVSFERDPATGRWDVVGIPASLKKTFSRRQQRVREAAGHGATPAQERAAARSTARAKVASTPETERESWHERALEAKHRPQQIVAQALGREPGDPTATRAPGGPDPGPRSPDEVAAAVWDFETGVTAHTKVVTRAKVMAHVAGALGVGLPDAAMLEALTDHALAHELALALPASGPVHMSHADRYTSADIPAAERVIMGAARARYGTGTAVVNRHRATHAIRSWQRQKGFRLSKEQLQVVARLIGHGHGLDAVIGVAGAGKTTIMSAARTAWETQGYRVEGAAVAAVAAAGLRAGAGITSRTVASWRKRITDGPGLTGVGVLVVDEAAMIGDRDLALLVEEAGRTGTKLVLVGDPLQLRSVAAGGSFGPLHQAVDGLTLTENRRQRREVDQDALATWRAGGRRSALAMWGEHGQLHATKDADAAHDQMVGAWWADRRSYDDGHQAVERLLMVATTNADVDELNHRARAAARSGGLLEGDDVAFQQATGAELVLAAGDQVRVRANDYRSRSSDDPDVLNGYRGLVRDVDVERGALVEWRREGEVESAWITPDQLHRGDLSLGYAVTIAAAQGVTVDRCHVYGLGADAHGLYAGMSRATERVDLYLPSVELEREEVRQRLGQARTEKERCERTINAYADTLTQDPPGLVLEELEKTAPPIGQVVPARPETVPVPEAEREPEQRRDQRQDRDRTGVQSHDAPRSEVQDRAVSGQETVERTPEQEREDAAPTPWRPLTLDEVHAGQGPHCRQVTDQVSELHQRAAALEASLPDLREEYQAARDRAHNTSRMRLLLEGTTPKAAQTEAQQVGERLREAMHGANEARVQAREVWSHAQHEDMRRHLADAQRERREAELERMEPIAAQHGLTREELHALDREEREQMLRRHGIQVAHPDYRTQHETKIELTRSEQRQMRWEALPEQEREAIQERQAQAAQAHREHLEQSRAAAQAAERSGPELGL
ncbi:relaxase domain-containing protein [Nocardiopsis sp. EMB25]|uniref:MobF family relaxase n=1 Tax=Nocardiopsis sp. EMB25 TaxID=2835867 RepID=UPI00228443BA|nr:MobF family relaxase [Nocardiopsis sp. EMB25]MCY9787918.1 relaxase domain-containing protein [Nocardiopsis sp. EMB25]